ncbi:hypothetical protein BH11BAC2_BH11BAC2_24330 [soil metagenome]
MSSSLPYSYLAIEGNIGAGKTSLAKILATKFNAELALESFAENTFLPQFYEQPERFAFPLEMSFLAERYQQIKQQQELATKLKSPLISDYIFEKSVLFAQVNLKGHELELFRKFFSLINQQLARPGLVVYLKKTTDSLLKNIAARGRDYEKSIPAEYLQNVSDQYLQHFKTLNGETVLIVESDELDFVENHVHLKFLIDLVQEKHIPGIHEILPEF